MASASEQGNGSGSSPADGSMTDGRSVQVIFSPAQYAKLQSLAQRQQIAPAAALVQALDIADIVVDADQNPQDRVLIQRGREVNELKLPKRS